MQIFRPYRDHHQAARWLCDSRLNKQVVEAYQIARVILMQMDLIPRTKRVGYAKHPITLHVYNEGAPYLPDLLRYMQACNEEWLRRGKNRSADFQAKMEHLFEIAKQHADRFLWDELPPFFASGEQRLQGEEAFGFYRQLLFDKWSSDKIIPKASIQRAPLPAAQ